MEKSTFEQMAKQEGIIELLREENQMEWIRRMNSVAAVRKKSYSTSTYTVERTMTGIEQGA